MSKEIIEYIINDLENKKLIKLPNIGKINKEKLIECWAIYREEPDWKYFNFYSAGSLSTANKNIFIGIEKNNQRPWKYHILNLYGYKYCNKCKELKLLEEFYNNISSCDNKAPICNKCAKANRDNCREYVKIYDSENKDHHNKLMREHYQNNKEMYVAKVAKRRSAKLNRTPIWSNLNKIKEFYLNCLEGQHVDHNIPLQGDLVSGLHVPLNLQIISATENLSKSNKFNPDIWDEQIELKKLGFEYPKYIGD